MPEPEASYLAGLKAAEDLCAQRSKRHVAESTRWEAEADKLSSLAAAVEALECAMAIKQLVEAAERADA